VYLSTTLNGTFEATYLVKAKGGTKKEVKVILDVLPPPEDLTNVTLAT